VVMEIVKAVGNVCLAGIWFNDFTDDNVRIDRLVGSILMTLTMLLFILAIAWPWMHFRMSKKNRLAAK
jgi:hypothetical protein